MPVCRKHYGQYVVPWHEIADAKRFPNDFRLTVKKKGMSTTELGAEVRVQQKTAWLFKRKVQVVMKQNGSDNPGDKADADETLMPRSGFSMT